MKAENFILLVVNPIAGDTDKDIIIETVKTEVSAKNLDFRLFQTTGQGDKEALQQIIEGEKPSRILVAGGDGTISFVAECIHGTDLCMGIIPAGSANGMAANLGIPPELKEQIAIALSPNIMKIDVVFINDRPCLHIADLGMNAELIKNYENSSIRGKLGYFLQSFPTLINSESPYDFTIETTEGIHRQSGVLLAIANANKFGTGATINPTGKINDGKFEILLFKNLDIVEILKTTQESPQMSPDFVDVISTCRATISTQQSVNFQIDGEYIGEVKSIKVTIEKQTLSIAVPNEFTGSTAPNTEL